LTARQIAICTLITIHSDGEDTKDIGSILNALGVSVDEIREALELQSDTEESQ